MVLPPLFISGGPAEDSRFWVQAANSGSMTSTARTFITAIPRVFVFIAPLLFSRQQLRRPHFAQYKTKFQNVCTYTRNWQFPGLLAAVCKTTVKQPIGLAGGCRSG
jgi:hypothetical protein